MNFLLLRCCIKLVCGFLGNFRIFQWFWNDDRTSSWWRSIWGIVPLTLKIIAHVTVDTTSFLNCVVSCASDLLSNKYIYLWWPSIVRPPTGFSLLHIVLFDMHHQQTLILKLGRALSYLLEVWSLISWFCSKLLLYEIVQNK